VPIGQVGAAAVAHKKGVAGKELPFSIITGFT
jgi:hypothetical protein